MSVEATRNFEDLHILLISNEGSYEEVRDLIKKDPLVLACHGWVSSLGSTTQCDPPLAIAIQNDNLDHARAILEALGNKEYASQILKEYRDYDRIKHDCRLEHPFYVTPSFDSGHVYLPHAFARSPEMLQLLHDHGYDLNIYEKDHATSFLDNYINIAANHIESGGSPRDKLDPLLRKSIELGLNLNERVFNTGIRKNASAAEYAYDQIVKKVMSLPQNADGRQFVNSDELYNFFKALADNGVDCRNAFKMQISVNSSTDAETLRRTQQHLEFYFTSQISKYSKAENPEQRRLHAVAACAGGKFPELLAKYAHDYSKKGNREEVTELLSYLDPYWKGQYRHAIASAEATIARESPVALNEGKNTFFDKYLPDNSKSWWRG